MRKLHKLTAARVGAVDKPGKYSDGGNLVLRVDDAGNKSWGLRYAIAGKETTIGLGAWPTVSLAEARDKAATARKLLADRRDPKSERDKGRAAERAAAARLITVAECARRFIADRDGSWRNEQHRRDFHNSIQRYILPAIGNLSVADVDTPAVLKVLERDDFWRQKPVTASRIRSRLEMLLDWAAARDYRARENPAAWAGFLDKVLPAPKSLAPVQHHAALPWQQLPAFMGDLRGRDGLAARALEFAILNASRISEVVDATWSEFDFENRTWTIPAARMKSHRTHVVPLSPRALEILNQMPRDDVRPFPIRRGAIGRFLRQRMGRSDTTVHGFRSSFSTWCAEATRFEVETREVALAHRVGDKTMETYMRGPLLQKRRLLMDAWSGYCGSPPAKPDRKVVALRA